MRTTLSRIAVLSLAGVWLVGCGGAEGPPQYPVTGTVTFDGEPIEDGTILFRQTEGDKKAFAGQITDGAYEVLAEAGEMTVQIRASRVVPGKFDTTTNPPAPGEEVEPAPVSEMYIPAKYNSQTTLEATVTEDGENKFPFELTSK